MLKYIWNLLPFDMSNSITMDLEKSGINTPKDKEDQMTQELIKEAESIKHTHNTIKEQKPLGNGKALWTVHSDYIENLENIKEKLTEALKEQQQVMDSEKLVEKFRDSIRERSGGHNLKNLNGDYLWQTKEPINLTELANIVLNK